MRWNLQRSGKIGNNRVARDRGSQVQYSTVQISIRNNYRRRTYTAVPGSDLEIEMKIIIIDDIDDTPGWESKTICPEHALALARVSTTVHRTSIVTESDRVGRRSSP